MKTTWKWNYGLGVPPGEWEFEDPMTGMRYEVKGSIGTLASKIAGHRVANGKGPQSISGVISEISCVLCEQFPEEEQKRVCFRVKDHRTIRDRISGVTALAKVKIKGPDAFTDYHSALNPRQHLRELSSQSGVGEKQSRKEGRQNHVLDCSRHGQVAS